jgi:two-component system nitrogen regulation response regulator NtrX
MQQILVIDDESNIRSTLQLVLRDEGYSVDLASDIKSGEKIFSSKNIDVILLDVKLPDGNGVNFLKEIKRNCPGIEVIMISGHGTIEMAIDAIKLGGYDFLEKPLSLDKTKLTVKHAIEKVRFEKEKKEWQENQLNKMKIVGESDAIQKIKEQIIQVALSDSKVLITGESGTGKELVAYAIHFQSNRADKPFVKVNCASIPSELIESELFGHEKGAFTGALSKHIGKFERANGGTLFLDEIGDMNLSAQAKVLRALEEKEIERVGGTETIKVDVRVISATNKNIIEEVKNKIFREDLYYRLNVFPIHIPPLRERKSDIQLLLEYFLKNFCFENNKRQKLFSNEAIELLKNHTFPGNVRELRNIIERSVISVNDDEIKLEHLDFLYKNHSVEDIFTTPRPLQEAQNELEKKYIETQLKLNNYDYVKTAEILGMERTNLHRKIKQLGIEKPK